MEQISTGIDQDGADAIVALSTERNVLVNTVRALLDSCDFITAERDALPARIAAAIEAQRERDSHAIVAEWNEPYETAMRRAARVAREWTARGDEK